MSVLPVLTSKEVRLRQRFGHMATKTSSLSDSSTALYPGVRVPNVSRDIRVKIASTVDEWEQAFQLITENYRQRGYESSAPGQIRFTPYHGLPETVVLVAKHQERVIYTMTLVFDNVLLGLPMESLYHAEIARMRAAGCQIMEVSCLASQDLSLREFTPVFTSMVRLTIHYSLSVGAESWVISVNPKHRRFYTKIVGFVSFGPVKNCPWVENHLAEPFILDTTLLKNNAPSMYDEVFGESLEPEALYASSMPAEFVHQFSQRSSQLTEYEARHITEWVKVFGSPQRW